MSRILFLLITTFLGFALSSTIDDFKIITNAIASVFEEKSNRYPAKFEVEQGNSPQVETPLGKITGITFREAYGFYSLPYAKPPVGDLRFKKSLLVDSYPNMEYNASVIDRLACYQRLQDCINGICVEKISEDCLVLNIHVPKNVDLATASFAKLPVIFWIHGGGFRVGSATTPLYDGRFLSNVTSSIVVGINYRLGALGFLAIPEGNNFVCNQGFNDQQLALEWVNKYIENFGGDNTRVTIVGNSAGAQSVMFHLMSSKSAPYFHRAIMQSHPAIFKYPTIEEAVEDTEEILNITNCGGLNEEGIECLRNLDADSLLSVYAQMMVRNLFRRDLFGTAEVFRVVLDGVEFTRNPIQFLQQGGWMNDNKVIIMGTNIEETNHISVYIPNWFKFDKQRFENLLKFAFGDQVGLMIANKYGNMTDDEAATDYVAILGEAITDGFFVCPTRIIARLVSSYTSTYLYSFAHRMDDPSCEYSWIPGEVCNYVYHSSENSFVFRSDLLIKYNFSENDIKAVNQFSYYWGNLAVSGDPNSGDVISLEEYPEWPKYNLTRNKESVIIPMQVNRFDFLNTYPWTNYVVDSPTGRLDQHYKQDICDFWDSTKYYVNLENDDFITSTNKPASNVTTTVNNLVTSIASNVTITLGWPEQSTSNGVAYNSSSTQFFILCVLLNLLMSL